MTSGRRDGARTRVWWVAAILLAAVGAVSLLVWQQQQGGPDVGGTAPSAYDDGHGAGTAGIPAAHRQRQRQRPPSAASRRPQRLDIASLGVSTPLVRLGLQPDRTVEVPRNPDLAGWYRFGPPPGAWGSAVILGHVDSMAGPAVFARLGAARAGTEIDVALSGGSVAEFVVTAVVTYPNAVFPAQRVYAARGGRRLNLVTCGGGYDADNGGYQGNVVVYSRWVRTTRS